MKNKVALIDMDGVLCRWDDSMVPYLKSLESPLEQGLYDYSNVCPLQQKYKHIEARADLVMSRQGFWTGLKPYESGLEIYSRIAKKFETYILTKALKKCSLAWKEKVDWLHRYIGNDIHIMVVTDKKLVKGDLMVDDLPKNADEWLETNPNGRVLMPLREYNKNYKRKNVDLWDDSCIGQDWEAINDYEDRECILRDVYDYAIPNKVIDEVLWEPKSKPKRCDICGRLHCPEH